MRVEDVLATGRLAVIVRDEPEVGSASARAEGWLAENSYRSVAFVHVMSPGPALALKPAMAKPSGSVATVTGREVEAPATTAIWLSTRVACWLRVHAEIVGRVLASLTTVRSTVVPSGSGTRWVADPPLVSLVGANMGVD